MAHLNENHENEAPRTRNWGCPRLRGAEGTRLPSPARRPAVVSSGVLFPSRLPRQKARHPSACRVNADNRHPKCAVKKCEAQCSSSYVSGAGAGAEPLTQAGPPGDGGVAVAWLSVGNSGRGSAFCETPVVVGLQLVPRVWNPTSVTSLPEADAAPIESWWTSLQPRCTLDDLSSHVYPRPRVCPLRSVLFNEFISFPQRLDRRNGLTLKCDTHA